MKMQCNLGSWLLKASLVQNHLAKDQKNIWWSIGLKSNKAIFILADYPETLFTPTIYSHCETIYEKNNVDKQKMIYASLLPGGNRR